MGKKKRVSVPNPIETDLLIKSRRRCPLCVYLKHDLGEKHLQIAHIDNNPANNNLDNLVLLCPDHHIEIHQKNPISKGFSPEEIKHYRDFLYKDIGDLISKNISVPGEEKENIWKLQLDNKIQTEFNVTAILFNRIASTPRDTALPGLIENYVKRFQDPYFRPQLLEKSLDHTILELIDGKIRVEIKKPLLKGVFPVIELLLEGKSLEFENPNDLGRVFEVLQNLAKERDNFKPTIPVNIPIFKIEIKESNGKNERGGRQFNVSFTNNSLKTIKFEGIELQTSRFQSFTLKNFFASGVPVKQTLQEKFTEEEILAHLDRTQSGQKIELYITFFSENYERKLFSDSIFIEPSIDEILHARQKHDESNSIVEKDNSPIPKKEKITAILHYNTNYKTLLPEDIIHEFDEFEFSSVQELPSDENLWTKNQWELVKEREKKFVLELLKHTDLPSTYLVYSINFLPLIIHLGFQFTARQQTRVFQYHRGNERFWRWEPLKGGTESPHLLIDDSFSTKPSDEPDLLFIVEISSPVALADCQKTVSSPAGICRIYVSNPCEDWLKFHEQVDEFQHCLTQVLAQIRKWNPQLQRIHVFFAGPAPCAFIFGQAINPTMTPEIYLYNFNAREDPKYKFAFKL